MAQELKERMNNWDCIKLKTSVQQKETVTRFKGLPTKLKEILAVYSSDRD
jgi:hypothetical protein